MKLSFNGAAGLVTGSCHHVQTGSQQFLIDCGMFQGSVRETRMNRDPLHFDPAQLDFVILTHSHIDHSGRLPILVRQGFKGKIFMTPPTRELAEILLLDSAQIQLADQQKDASPGEAIEDVLYTEDDVLDTLQYFYPIEYGKTHREGDITFTLRNAGHLLGSAFVELEMEGKTVVFSGDLGHRHALLLDPPQPMTKADILITESTYGNRHHEHLDTRLEKLFEEILGTYAAGGTSIIPAFSVGRTQDMLYALKRYAELSGRITQFNRIPVYVDSPLAINATDIFLKFESYLSDAFDREYMTYKNVHIVRSMKDSIGLNLDRSPKVIISAAGMCDAGRILNHLESYLPDPTTKMVFVGYQSEESLGRKILEKESPVYIRKKPVENRAHIVRVEGFSGHGDLEDIKDWIGTLKTPPGKTILVHGETDGLANLKRELTQKGHTVLIAEMFETLEL